MSLLPPEIRRKLRALHFAHDRRLRGAARGGHRSPRRGQSQEFADHRAYTPGDDFRFLDWHLYSRLDELWVKLFEEEQDRSVHLLLDCSASMRGGKLDATKGIAAALSFVALGGSDRVALGGLDTGVVRYEPPRRGRGGLAPLLTALEGLGAEGETDLARAIESYPRQRGAVLGVLFTDLLWAGGPDSVLRRLAARTDELTVVHVLSPEDLAPPMRGDLIVVDAETGEEVAVTMNERARARFREAAEQWADEMAGRCRHAGARYLRVRSDASLDETVMGPLRRIGVLG